MTSCRRLKKIGEIMKYTIEELNSWMDELQAEEKEIRIDRGKRYGTDEDTLGNVSEFGADGAIVSMWECHRRIMNNSGIPDPILRDLDSFARPIRQAFNKKKNLPDIKNAVQDLRNYAAYILNLAERDE